MSFTGFGVVAGAALTEAVRRAGADHVEPTIADNLALRSDHGGGWDRNDVYAGDRFPSFAILVPGDLALLTADPGAVRDYFDAVLPIVRSVADPEAKIVFGSGPPARHPTACPMPRPTAVSRRCSAPPGTSRRRVTSASCSNR
ncbi:hypothetical protein P9139_08725 [Curtobacterium flaccumfaciens]|nr:hypothetical protein P9139_08725 [Curtobacterium flaccumfaciens]